MFGISFSAANVFATNAKCSYKDSDTFVVTCEKQDATTPQTETQPAAQPSSETQLAPVSQAEQPAEPVAQEEDIAVPIVGDTEESYVEPLGETASWYPDQPNYDNVVSYQYGKSTEFVASLANPEEGITTSDIVLIVIIVLSLMTIVAAAMMLTGRAVTSRVAVKRKDFIKK
ncbi:hypothetical protein IJ114_00905 [Candidatus Saccharibacteria bacterium]|nr:hypothetical protein [Candidatus Saccharibacteria bacterium]